MKDAMIILTIASAMTSLITEALKKILGDLKYSPNILAAVVAVVTAGGICAGYLILNGIALSPEIWVYIVAIVVLTWLCATLGYDKVLQTLKQLGGGTK